MRSTLISQRTPRRVRRQRGPATPQTTFAPDSDEHLMLCFAAGDAEAFERLYERHRAPLYRFVGRSINDAGLAEELYQDIWLRVIKARDRYQPRARFQTWLYRIATNRIIDHVRAAKPESSLDAECPQEWLTDTAAHTADAPDRARLAEALATAVAELPIEQRTAFLLQTERGLTLEEIATISGVGRETVKSRLRYAMNKLRDSLGGWHASLS